MDDSGTLSLSRRAGGWFALGLLVAAVAGVYAQVSDGLFSALPSHPAIEYAMRPVNDPVAALNRKIQEGAVKLQLDGAKGSLQSVLGVLSVPIESQVVPFSKTSVQMARITPTNPRTIFFNDSVAVGWVRGGFVELAAQDPEQGVIFYVLDPRLSEKPGFVRSDGCLTCHLSNDALGVPGMLMRSVFPGPDGTALRQLGSHVTDHRSPREERWGGWYVTGVPGSIRHMGNAIVFDRENPESMIAERSLELESLREKFDTDAYLSPYSDIVALLVFEHQMHMMNLLTRVGWETRVALHDHGTIDPRLLQDMARELVDYLLFIDEEPLPGIVTGTSGFAEQFAAQGPYDRKGRSLRQLDLHRRMMRYPCSYMIYTEAFDKLPAEARQAIYARMWDVLSGKEQTVKYARLSVSDRKVIVEILQETKKGLPDYFNLNTP